MRTSRAPCRKHRDRPCDSSVQVDRNTHHPVPSSMPARGRRSERSHTLTTTSLHRLRGIHRRRLARWRTRNRRRSTRFLEQRECLDRSFDKARCPEKTCGDFVDGTDAVEPQSPRELSRGERFAGTYRDPDDLSLQRGHNHGHTPDISGRATESPHPHPTGRRVAPPRCSRRSGLPWLWNQGRHRRRGNLSPSRRDSGGRNRPLHRRTSR